ncbi:MAG: DUF5667 domain-containing protein [Candidatus Roizmanbacteria bacterium]|nr:DUF5667 domain-containing protein [Candidatus Roizmanbacteria bacterium]
MKKSSLAIALSVSIITLVLSSSSYAIGEGEKLIQSSESVSIPSIEVGPTGSETASEQMVEYTLPYPGILPDHPLYPFKKFRDRLLDFLIRDPVKRIEFNLLMADKRYNMGLFFSDEEKYERALTILEEAESFYGRIPDEMQVVKDQNRTLPPDLLQKIKTATTKHQEIIIEIQNKSPEDMSERYEKIMQQSYENRQKIEEKGK